MHPGEYQDLGTSTDYRIQNFTLNIFGTMICPAHSVFYFLLGFVVPNVFELFQWFVITLCSAIFICIHSCVLPAVDDICAG